jgi:hypothetical protein
MACITEPQFSFNEGCVCDMLSLGAWHVQQDGTLVLLNPEIVERFAPGRVVELSRHAEVYFARFKRVLLGE